MYDYFYIYDSILLLLNELNNLIIITSSSIQVMTQNTCPCHILSSSQPSDRHQNKNSQNCTSRTKREPQAAARAHWELHHEPPTCVTIVTPPTSPEFKSDVWAVPAVIPTSVTPNTNICLRGSSIPAFIPASPLSLIVIDNHLADMFTDNTRPPPANSATPAAATAKPRYHYHWHLQRSPARTPYWLPFLIFLSSPS